MAVLCSPFGPKPQFELSSGVPAVGNKLFFYVAGSVGTKQNTYSSSTGLSANTNPIILDALGMPTTTEIWFTSGQTYKVVYAPSTDTDPPTSPIWTIDNLSGINDVSASFDEWKAGPTPTFVSATSFTLVGDQTSTFTKSRRVKTTNTGGTIFSTITNSVFGVVTTVTVANDSGVLDSGLSAVSYSLISAVNPSIDADMVNRKGTAVASAATTDIWSIVGDYVHVTGAVTITSLGTAPYAGARREVIFDGALTLTHNATTLQLPGGANIVAAAGDRAIVRADTTANMIVVDFVKAGIAPLTATQTANTVYAGPTTGAAAAPAFRALVPADLSMTPIANALSGDVALSNTANYFDGPSVAQGTAGTWFASGSVTVFDTAGAATFSAKLWDGTTVIASCQGVSEVASHALTLSLSGFISSPAANIRISVRDTTATTGKILFNQTGNSKDSIVTALRIA